MDRIDVYLFEDKKLFKTLYLGDMVEQSQRELVHRKSVFLLEMEVGQTIEIYANNSNFGAMDIGWDIVYLKEFLESSLFDTIFFGLVGGFFIAQFIYIANIYRTIKEKALVIYLAVVVCFFFSQYSMAGIFYQLDIGVSVYWNTFFAFGVPTIGIGLLALFPVYFFDLKNILKYNMKILSFLGWLMIFLGFLALLYPLYENILYILGSILPIALLLSIILIYTGFRVFRMKLLGADYYFAGMTIFVVTLFYFVLGLFGAIEITNVFYYSLSLGTVFEILFMAFTIFAKIAKMKEEKEKIEKIYNEYSNLLVVGQSVISIAHQWKTPINHIHYALNQIEVSKEFLDPNFNTIVDENIKKIRNSTEMMIETSANFLDVYANNSLKREVNLVNELDAISKMVVNDNKDIVVDIVSKSKNIIFHTNKNMFLNLFLILLENSIQNLRKMEVENPRISIRIVINKKEIAITFEDNGGGIKVSPIEKIFEKDFSDSNSTGLGLAIAKDIVEKKLDGTIQVKNGENGAIFTIFLFV
jgi:signal transduction histidine kinase